jgi:hypothetical protein
MIKPPQRMNVSTTGALKAIFNLRCDAAYTIPPYPMWGIISDTTNLHLTSNGVYDACGLKSAKSNISSDTPSEVISRRKSFIQNKTKDVNLDNIRPYQQRGRWNINPATTYHYYLTLHRIQLKTISSRCKSKFNSSIHFWKSDKAQLW